MAQMIATKTRPAYQAYQLLYLGLMLGALALARLSDEFAEGAA